MKLARLEPSGKKVREVYFEHVAFKILTLYPKA